MPSKQEIWQQNKIQNDIMEFPSICMSLGVSGCVCMCICVPVHVCHDTRIFTTVGC